MKPRHTKLKEVMIILGVVYKVRGLSQPRRWLHSLPSVLKHFNVFTIIILLLSFYDFSGGV